MNNRVKNIVVTIVFSLFIGIFFLLCIFHKPVDVSESERRPLAQFPEITWQGIVDTDVMDEFDDYANDQFPFREPFRKLYTMFRMYVMNHKDINDIAIENGYLAEIKKSLNEKSVENALEKINMIYDQYLKESGSNVYFTVVPDKGYHLGKLGYPSLDYDKLVSMMKEGLSDMEYIDLFDELTLEDYYKTDTHWSQDKIEKIAMKIAIALDCEERLKTGYQVNELYPFYGVYTGQTLLDLEPDTLRYLTNDILDACTVYNYETGKTGSIYDLDKFQGTDGYDMFLSGTQALLRIDNPNATTDEELIVFRDSFGSSLIPLLAEGYKSIYIVDIRYISPSLLGHPLFGLNFENKDVLFMYSSLILDNSFSFKS